MEPSDDSAAPLVDQDLDPSTQEDGDATGEGGSDPRTREIDQLIAKVAAEEQATANELETLVARLEPTRRLIVLRGRSYYRLLHAGLLPAGAGFESVVDHAAQVERTRLALSRDLNAETTMGARKAELEAKLGRLRAERAPLEVQRRALLAAEEALQEAEDRRLAFEQAFQDSQQPPSLGAVRSLNGPSSGEPTGLERFRSLRGRLPFPIAGNVEVRQAERKDHQGPGLELLAPLGTTVRGVAAGRVAFADSYDAYGLTVILDHGDNYYSVYGGLAATELHVGDTVEALGPVGVIGVSRGRGMLYFELRQKAETIEPGPWFGI